MLDTKEILAKQNPNPVAISIAQLELGATLPWTIEGIAKGYHISERGARHLLSEGCVDGHIEAWLASHGFDVRSDRKRGWLFISQNNGATYRVRTCKHTVNLRPPLTNAAGHFVTPGQTKKKEVDTVHGWALVFVCDLPAAPVWFVSMKMVYVLRDKGLLDDHFTCRKGKTMLLHDFLIQAHGEGLYATA